MKMALAHAHVSFKILPHNSLPPFWNRQQRYSQIFLHAVGRHPPSEAANKLQPQVPEQQNPHTQAMPLSTVAQGMLLGTLKFGVLGGSVYLLSCDINVFLKEYIYGATLGPLAGSRQVEVVQGRQAQLSFCMVLSSAVVSRSTFCCTISSINLHMGVSRTSQGQSMHTQATKHRDADFSSGWSLLG